MAGEGERCGVTIERMLTEENEKAAHRMVNPMDRADVAEFSEWCQREFPRAKRVA